MPAKLWLDGYYCSQLLPWEEWHAGGRLHGARVHYRRYYPNSNWLGSYRDAPFDFWNESQFLIQEMIEAVKRGRGPTDSESNPLWIAGTYEVIGDRLLERSTEDRGGGYVWEREFAILDDRIVGHNGALTLLFKPER